MDPLYPYPEKQGKGMRCLGSKSSILIGAEELVRNGQTTG